jgi:hypothetical protein
MHRGRRAIAASPRVRGWNMIGLRGSTQLAAKFGDADARGYDTGPLV